MSDDLKQNSIRLDIIIEPDTDIIDIAVGHNLTDDLEEGQVAFYLDVLNGLVHGLKNNMEGSASVGILLRQLAILTEEDDDDIIDFEPDDQLIEAVKDNKVIQFKKKLH